MHSPLFISDMNALAECIAEQLLLKMQRILPQRYFLAIMCCLGLTVSYIMRFCLALAITEMASPPFVKEDPHACPYPPNYGEDNITKAEEKLNWTEKQQGLILSSFFWGYVITPISGGLLSERYGAKPVLGGGVAMTAISTLLTPTAVHYGDWKGLIAIRVLLGLSQGVVYASLHTAVAHWIPMQERGTWGTVVFSGAHIGNTLSMFCTSHIMIGYKKWEMVFYLYGAIGILWTVLFLFSTFSTPAEHPLLSPKEKSILCDYIAKVKKRKSNKGTPWKKILTSKPVWSIIIAMIGHDWGMFALVTDIPKYMKSVLHFNMRQNGHILAIGYFSIWIVGISSGMLVDFIEENNIISLSLNRKVMATIASLGLAFGLIGASYSGCDKTVAMICLIFGMGLMGFFYPSLKVNPIDLAPNFAGTVGALCHSIGGLSGIVVPYIIGILTPNGFLMEWRTVFWITFTIILSTNLYYCLTASAEIQPWNDDTEEVPLITERD